MPYGILTECMCCWIEYLGWYQCWRVAASITVNSLDCCCFWFANHCRCCRSHHWIMCFLKLSTDLYIWHFITYPKYFSLFSLYSSLSHRYICMEVKEGSKFVCENCQRQKIYSDFTFESIICFVVSICTLFLSLSLSHSLLFLLLLKKKRRPSVDEISRITRKNIIEKASSWVCCILNLI